MSFFLLLISLAAFSGAAQAVCRNLLPGNTCAELRAEQMFPCAFYHVMLTKCQLECGYCVQTCADSHKCTEGWTPKDAPMIVCNTGSSSYPCTDARCCDPPVVPSVTCDDIAVDDVQAAGDRFCVGDGTLFDVHLVGIPDGLPAYATNEDTNEVVQRGVFQVLRPPNSVSEIVLEVHRGADILHCPITVSTPCSCEVGDNGTCPADLICCSERKVCDTYDLDDPSACGDPHMTGFLGQKFDFTGEDGAWYSLISDRNMNINMRVTSPVVDLPEITYITGLSVLTTDADGFDHNIVIQVKEPHSVDSACPAGVSSPCLADGSLTVLLDGEEALLAPGTVSLGRDVEISAANLPGACRSFGFETYWERKKLENGRHGRRLGESMSMGEWILRDPTATNMDECVEYVARAEDEQGGVFAHQSEHTSFQIVTPKATIRLSHGRLHQIAMRDPTDQYDLPDHLTWQMNMAVDHNEVTRDARGILGETFVPTKDADGKPIMNGMEAIRGNQEDYRVEGALGADLFQGVHAF